MSETVPPLATVSLSARMIGGWRYLKYVIIVYTFWIVCVSDNHEGLLV